MNEFQDDSLAMLQRGIIITSIHLYFYTVRDGIAKYYYTS